MKLRIVAAVLLTATPAFAADVTVSDGWFRALPGKLPAGGYFTMHNGGAQEVSLIRADSKACGMLMLHKSSETGGMSSMEDVSSVAVPKDGTVSFAPGGYHLMCMDAAMKPGDKVQVTLHFSDGGAVNADFAVKDAQGR